MGSLIWLIRSFFSFILGILIFVGFLVFLVLDSSDLLFSADFYKDTLNEENTYERIYDEVLLDNEIRDTTDDLLGDIEVVNHDDIVRLLREIMPPEYLREQVEGTITRTVDYFNEDVETLEVYIDLGPPLDTVKPVLFNYIDERIDELDAALPDSSKGPLDQVEEIGDRMETIFRELAQGKVPQSIPSVQAIPLPFRAAAFDAFMGVLLEDPALNERVRQGLQDSREDIRREFVDGDTKGVLKEAARSSATPLMDDAIAEVKKELDSQERFDLIHRIAVWNDDISEGSLRSDIDDARGLIIDFRDLGNTVALGIVIGGAILMGLIHLPSLGGAVRWPGITLLLTNGVFYGAAKFAQSALPDRLDDVVERGTEEVTTIPPSVTDLGSDIIRSFTEQIISGFEGPALSLVFVGAALVAGSVVVSIVGAFMPKPRYR